ncbi:hypothetical protein ACFXP7_08335 [Microbacterium sp. P06]|uniref:hypothetical protein n=1 Tax=Microbacterium sp. P06 TaxID=3366949 RepID=UPI003746F288
MKTPEEASNMNESNYDEQLARDTRDAKRAPEIAAWLRLGPLYFQEIIAFRRDRLVEQGYDEATVTARATESVLHDLGRVGGLGGPVVFDGQTFSLNEERRAAVDAWVREDAERTLAVFERQTSDDS